MNDIAHIYVRLVLALGSHDPDYVDAYIGPEELRAEVEAEGLATADIGRRASEALASLEALDVSGDPTEIARRRNLEVSFKALVARTEMLEGKTFTFDQESRALYDAVAPTHGEDHYRNVLDRLDAALPGEGSLVERYDAFRADFVVPPERLDAVFQTAIEACRERTLAYLELPPEESFVVEYVTDKSWSGYNWYQGDFQSLIQVNTDLPIYIDRAVDLACHEGYPGHHVYNLLIERDLLRGKGWEEFSVYALFSPRSLIAEGTANFGIETAFPAQEREVFEREVLFPAAGLDPSKATDYYRVLELAQELSFAGNEAARRYLDGEIDADQAAAWLSEFSMMPAPRAAQRVRFIDQYRSYVINYNLGMELVRAWVEAEGGTADEPERRWELFSTLLREPILPSDLVGAGD